MRRPRRSTRSRAGRRAGRAHHGERPEARQQGAPRSYDALRMQLGDFLVAHAEHAAVDLSVVLAEAWRGEVEAPVGARGVHGDAFDADTAHLGVRDLGPEP